MNRNRYRVVSLGVVLMGAALLGVPVSAYAVPTTSTTSADSAVDAKRAEAESARSALRRTQSELDAQVESYASLGRRIAETRAEISVVATELSALDAKLTAAEHALERRAVQLYRRDRVGMLQILLDARSVQDLLVRANYLVMISGRDMRLVDEVRRSRTESAWLQSHLGNRIQALVDMQTQADDERIAIEQRMEAQERRAKELGEDLARLIASGRLGGGSAPSGGFNPDTVISEAQFRDARSMTTTDVQTFLNEQSGSLKSYMAADHAGERKSVAEMITDAAVAWGVNPKVILVKLQKEQSLLSRANPQQRALDWALGCGRADSRTFYQYQGFGKQIWFGAQKLDQNSKPWRAGIKMSIDGNATYPTNAATYSLYKYTPHLRGTMSFWLLYWRYFGDPAV